MMKEKDAYSYFDIRNSLFDIQYFNISPIATLLGQFIYPLI
jgi:hypothetical protein